MAAATHLAHPHASQTAKGIHIRKKRVSFDAGKIVPIIGRIASAFSIIMYVSYIAQIANNLAGDVGTPWQPLAACFNCVFWAAYGFLKTPRDWPIVVANVPGIFLALATFVTTFIH